ncbi:hypothetical protein NPIL_311881 [Nephila pilipes]|uniref:Uncharacterized protein n=1 Tax=Nephila pilipes TaxID=299642 RepID=A0A8X6TKA9_NEPPI|nr:hypothetical protein NPIL_311881 [Nephila pilipes]
MAGSALAVYVAVMQAVLVCYFSSAMATTAGVKGTGGTIWRRLWLLFKQCLCVPRALATPATVCLPSALPWLNGMECTWFTAGSQRKRFAAWWQLAAPNAEAGKEDSGRL